MQETRSPAERAESFDERVVRALNDAAMVLSCSIGHRTMLFDAIPQDRFALPAEIAERAGLHPRYVRQWLGAWRPGEWSRSTPRTASGFHRNAPRSSPAPPETPTSAPRSGG